MRFSSILAIVYAEQLKVDNEPFSKLGRLSTTDHSSGCENITVIQAVFASELAAEVVKAGVGGQMLMGTMLQVDFVVDGV